MRKLRARKKLKALLDEEGQSSFVCSRAWLPKGLRFRSRSYAVCRWFGVPHRTVYYCSVKSVPKVDSKYAEPIKAMIEQSLSFGYRTVAWLLGFNKNIVQRIFQIKS